MGEKRIKLSNSGYALLAAIIAINIFAVLVMKGRSMWEVELQRDLEEELFFRAKQYVFAIEQYMKKNSNLPPQNFDVLLKGKFLRQRYRDPITNSEKWNIVLRSMTSAKGDLLVVPEDQLDAYVTQGQIIGVASSSCEEGYRIYRKKKKYCEWAFYIGDDPKKEMPELKYVDESGKIKASDKEETTEDNSTINEEKLRERERREEGREPESGREEVVSEEGDEDPGRG